MQPELSTRDIRAHLEEVPRAEGVPADPVAAHKKCRSGGSTEPAEPGLWSHVSIVFLDALRSKSHAESRQVKWLLKKQRPVLLSPGVTPERNVSFWGMGCQIMKGQKPASR